MAPRVGLEPTTSPLTAVTEPLGLVLFGGGRTHGRRSHLFGVDKRKPGARPSLVRTPGIEPGPSVWRTDTRPSCCIREVVENGRSRTSRRTGIAFTARRQDRLSLFAFSVTRLRELDSN